MSRIYLGALPCARAEEGSATPGEGILTEEETRRARSLASPAAVRRFVAGRRLARSMLSDLLALPPVLVPISVSPEGRPSLASAGPWHFSISHSSDLAVCAVADIPVGVDVERVAPERDLLGIARETFHQVEADDVAALFKEGRDAAAARFALYWTLKEAYLKLRGAGVWEMRDAPVFLLEGPRAPRAEGDPSRWWCLEIPREGASGRGYVISLGAYPLTKGEESADPPVLHLAGRLAEAPQARPLFSCRVDVLPGGTGGMK
jgi:phosphopantetheinyl transferase